MGYTEYKIRVALCRYKAAAFLASTFATVLSVGVLCPWSEGGAQAKTNSFVSVQAL